VQEGLLDLFFNQTINCERYVQVIAGKFFPQLTEEEILYGWFQQDSATAHTARTVCLCMLCPMSSGTELSAVLFGQHVHPILILVIFSYRVVSRTKFTTGTDDRKNQKKNVCKETANIPAEQLQRVNQNLFR
jgi:hypothetical protein